MGSGIRGLLAGALVLVALHTVVQPAAAGRVGSLLQLPAAAAKRFLDPTVPAIPERREATRDLTADGGGSRVGDGVLGGGPASPPATRYPDPWAPPTTR